MSISFFAARAGVLLAICFVSMFAGCNQSSEESAHRIADRSPLIPACDTITAGANFYDTMTEPEQVSVPESDERGLKDSSSDLIQRPTGIPYPHRDLELAVRDDDSATVESLLIAGISVEGMTSDGYSLLHLASVHSDPRLAMLLLKWGADPDAVSLSGETSLDVLRREGLISESIRDAPYSDILQNRLLRGIERAFELAEQSIERGNELAAMRREMLAEFEVDRARFKAQASLYSFSITGVETALPMRFWDVPTDERPPGWMANYNTTDTLPQARLTSESVPLSDDFDAPLELPIPPQFDEAIEVTHWAVIQAGLAHGVSSPEFRQVLERAKKIVSDADTGKRG